jgi:outer membrane protein assembly factor BamA
MRLVFLLLFFQSNVWQTNAQQFYALHSEQASIPKALSALEFTTAQYQQLAWVQKTNEWQALAIEAGYYLFTFELYQQKDSISFFKINPGPFFDGISLLTPDENTAGLTWIHAKDLQKLVQDSLALMLNNGYPFGQIELHFISDSIPRLEFRSKPGPMVKWGALQIKPDGIIQEKVLSNLLQIKPGNLFREEQLLQLQTQLLGQMPFKLLRAPEWALRDGYADVYLFLERVKMSSATGIVGLQQDPLSQKAALVGELNVQLQNTWQKNEKFNLHWRSIAPQTQQLKTSLSWPYIGGTSYGVQAGCALYKRDTSFLELKGNMGISYLFPRNWKALAQLDYWKSQTIAEVASNTLSNFNTISYGLGLERQMLDFLPNPRKGQQFRVVYLVGNKQSQKEDLTWRLELSQRYYFPIAKRHVLSLAQEFNHIQAAQIYSNELYRFGGLERMRGFNEDAFFASSVLFSGFEYRFLLDQFAHFLVFTDWAWLDNKVLNHQQTTVYAVGIGLVLGSDNGQFRLNYGLGAELGQALQFNAGKLHVGYISYF